MAKRQKRRATREEQPELDAMALARQAGQFEAATGVAHGPAAVAFVVVAAVVLVPLKRLAQAIGRRLQ